MDKGKLDHYCFTSGTPTYLINMMKKFDTVYTDFAEGMEADASDFDAPTETMTSITPCSIKADTSPSRTTTRSMTHTSWVSQTRKCASD